MSAFEIANIIVANGGDTLNTVPRYGVTAAEVAVLQVIHGTDSISNIIPRGTVERPQKVERARLKAVYGTARNHDGQLFVDLLYPGAAARVFETFDELELVDGQFASAPVRRAGTARQAEAVAISEEANLLVEQSNRNTPAAAEEGGFEEIEGDDEVIADEPADALA